MTTEADQHLQHLLATFDAAGLGEGDTSAGANLLAAMAITLANLARPGSGIMTKEGRIVPVGCDLIATSPLTTSVKRGRDEIFAESGGLAIISS